MKIAAFEVRPDERKDFKEISERLGVELVMYSEVITLDNVDLATGCEGVSTLGMCKLNGPLLDRLKELGVNYISTRTIGYNHIDLEYAKKLGMLV